MEAVKNNDANRIVASIERGISRSSNILVLVSDKTRSSWWVPYEVGFAKSNKIEIVSFLLQSAIGAFPEYLAIEKEVNNVDELEKYLDCLYEKFETESVLNPYGKYFLKHTLISQEDKKYLQEIMK